MTRALHDGRDDGLQPLQSLDIRGGKGLADLLEQMSHTAFGGRELGEAFQVLRAMADDPDCTLVVTVSGAMTIAKMGRVLCEMIDAGLAHMLVCTGAVMAHGLSEAIGCTHYKHDPAVSDQQLYKWGYNRVYDTLEMEANLWQAQELVSEVLDGFDWSQPACSWQINREIGPPAGREGPDAQHPGLRLPPRRAGLRAGLHRFGVGAGRGHLLPRPGIPAGPGGRPGGVFLPRAVLQSVPGPLRLRRGASSGPSGWAFSPSAAACPATGPSRSARSTRSSTSRLGANLPVPRFRYGVRLCPEPVHWGGLSGCTYTEGVSWGKFISVEEGGRFAEVHCDATIAWPLLVKALLEARDQGTGVRGQG